MSQRPSEKDQIQMVVKNLLSSIHQHLFFQYIPKFKTLMTTRAKIKDAINSGQIREEDSHESKNYNRGSKTAYEGTFAIQYLCIVSSTPKLGNKRKFGHILVPLSNLFQKLKEKRLLKPLQPWPPPANCPPHYNPNKHCAFHQGRWHDTDLCAVLRHAIQDLINEGRITTPPAPLPNIVTNPLPEHGRVYALILEVISMFDPSVLITTSLDPKESNVFDNISNNDLSNDHPVPPQVEEESSCSSKKDQALVSQPAARRARAQDVSFCSWGKKVRKNKTKQN